jgi:uncharacterized protein YbbC (DUF1343 family)
MIRIAEGRFRIHDSGSVLIVVALLLAFPHSGSPQTKVRLGADILVERRLSLLDGKRVGVITNQTGRLSTGEFLVDVLHAKGVNIVALFGPEHGIRGEAAAGAPLQDEKDIRTGIPIFSLYGKTRKPKPEMVRDVDVLVYDIQDVGARFYTYISTMTLAMEAAAEVNISFVVLDRPNPLGGEKIDGPLMEDSLKSFVGLLPIPVVYGLTCGELATMINRESWLHNGVRAQLTVIPMEGWRRTMLWEETGLQWISPSPSMPTPSTTLIYPASCFIEATNISEGRGTDEPFRVIGAPFINADTLASSLSHLKLGGVEFQPISFTPRSSKFSGQECHGVRLKLTDPRAFRPVSTGLHILQQIHKLYPTQCVLDRRAFNRLIGASAVWDSLSKGLSPDSLLSSWRGKLEEFRVLSSRYLLYDQH